MPEAAINEYRHLFLSEDKVRPTRERLMATPTGYPILAEQFNHPELRGPVAL
jgi:hypothetical protein